MLIKREAGIRHLRSIQKKCMGLFLLLSVGFICHSHSLFGDDNVGHFKTPKASVDKELKAIQHTQQTLTYYLNITDFAQSFIEIPTANVSGESSTISSKYLAGRAPVYNTDNEQVGTCSASFLCMQNESGIYTDISNFLSVDSGLIVSWFTPTTLINLELDSIVNSMVTECMVVASTKVGVNPFYGQTFDLIVSSEGGKIYFKFTRTGMIF